MHSITMSDIENFFPEKKKFCGVKLKELIDLEHLYEVNIFVYSLEPTKPDGEEGEEDIEKEEEDFAPEIAAHFDSPLPLPLPKYAVPQPVPESLFLY